MHLLFIAMLGLLPKLNRHAYTFDDFERIAKRQRIRIAVTEYDQEIKGYYCVERRGSRRIPYIVINRHLDDIQRTLTAFHELTHHALHVPVSAQHWYYCRRTAIAADRRQEYEADTIALIALLPLPLLLELADEDAAQLPPDMAELCRRRQQIFQRYGF